MTHGYLARVRGDTADAEADNLAAHAQFTRGGTLEADGIYLIAVFTLRGMAVVAVAERDEATTAYGDLLRCRGQVGGATTGAFALGPVDTVLGNLATLLGDPDAAVEHYAAAAELADRCGNRYLAAAARLRLQP